MIIIVVIGYALLIIYEFVPLYKQKKWTDFWVNGALTAASFAMAVLLTYDVKIPSPFKPITNFITSVFGHNM